MLFNHGRGSLDGSTIWAIRPHFGGDGGPASHRGIVFSEVLIRVLAMLIRALAGRIPFSLLLTRLQRMLHDVANCFSLIGVLGFLVRLSEVRLRKVLLLMHLADVAPRRMAGAYGGVKIRSVAHC